MCSSSAYIFSNLIDFALERTAIVPAKKPHFSRKDIERVRPLPVLSTSDLEIIRRLAAG